MCITSAQYKLNELLFLHISWQRISVGNELADIWVGYTTLRLFLKSILLCAMHSSPSHIRKNGIYCTRSCSFSWKLQLPTSIHFVLCNISKTSASVSSGVPNTEKVMKARGRRPSAFIVSRCLEPLMKQEARVFDMASQMKQ